jgi:hypothetical protein
VTVVGDFAVLASLSTGDRRVRNSGINDSTSWTVGTSLCDEQEFADGGRVTGLAGGEYGRVVQEKSIRRMIFQPGSDQAFRFERVENEHGAAAGYSLASTANTIYFLANDGFLFVQRQRPQSDRSAARQHMVPGELRQQPVFCGHCVYRPVRAADRLGVLQLGRLDQL